MGCHTWFYKKIDVSYEMAKEQYVKIHTNLINVFSHPESNAEEYEFYDFWSSKREWYLEVFKRQLRMVEKDLCKCAVMKKYQDENTLTVFVEKTNSHYIKADFHDVFRIGTYPEDELFSYDETIEFIERNKNKVYSHLGFNTFGYYDQMIDLWKIKLKSFWDKYPDGMIDFG